MKIKSLNIWIGLVANLSVLIGLLILVVELNQNTKVAQASAWQDLTGRMIELANIQTTDREVSEIILKTRESVELDGLEMQRYNTYFQSHIILGALGHTQLNDGLIVSGQLNGILSPLRGMLSTETGKQLWQNYKTGLSSGLVEIIEDSMRQREPENQFWE